MSQIAPLKVAVLGCGPLGTSIAHLIATNIENVPKPGPQDPRFDPKVNIWVPKLVVEWTPPPTTTHPSQNIQTPLTQTPSTEYLHQIINTSHTNPQYLPNVPLHPQIVAFCDPKECVNLADLIVLALPHQFVLQIIKKVKSAIKKDAKCVSFIRGFVFDGPSAIPFSISAVVKRIWGTDCVVFGGGGAKDFVFERRCECVIGYNYNSKDGTGDTTTPLLPIDSPSHSLPTQIGSLQTAILFQKILRNPKIDVKLVPNLLLVEVCGALKGIIGIASGLCAGLGGQIAGINTKLAIIKEGIEEIKRFGMAFFASSDFGTLSNNGSVGWADWALIDIVGTSLEGRNVILGAEFAQKGSNLGHLGPQNENLGVQRRPKKGSKSFVGSPLVSEEPNLPTEIDQLNNLSDSLTAAEVYLSLKRYSIDDLFPLFCTVYEIAFENEDIGKVLDVVSGSSVEVEGAVDRISELQSRTSTVKRTALNATLAEVVID